MSDQIKDQPHLFEPPPPVTLTLRDKFLVPPFSVLDARAGYWQERKRAWLSLGIRGELGRGENLLSMSDAVRDPGLYAARAAEAERAQFLLDSGAGRSRELLTQGRDSYGGNYDTAKGESAWGGGGTSIFDPVLCELAYRWFSPEGGQVFDPFAGGSVRGIVAAALGRKYLGTDLSAEQCAANEEQARAIGAALAWEHAPRWVCADARDALEHAPPASADLIFTCPPYYDLEVYSDDPRDLSKAESYDDFALAYRHCIDLAAKVLKPNRFAVIVVGEVRDNRKTGLYRGLVPDTIAAFQAAGLGYYNEAILITSVGSLPLRTARLFGPGRKLGKSHQNVLCFVKGSGRAAAEACPLQCGIAAEQGGAAFSENGKAELPEQPLAPASLNDLEIPF